MSNFGACAVRHLVSFYPSRLPTAVARGISNRAFYRPEALTVLSYTLHMTFEVDGRTESVPAFPPDLV